MSFWSSITLVENAALRLLLQHFWTVASRVFQLAAWAGLIAGLGVLRQMPDLDWVNVSLAPINVAIWVLPLVHAGAVGITFKEALVCSIEEAGVEFSDKEFIWLRLMGLMPVLAASSFWLWYIQGLESIGKAAGSG